MSQNLSSAAVVIGALRVNLFRILNFCMLGNVSCFCCRLLTHFKINLVKSLSECQTEDRHSVGPDLDPNCLNRFRVDNTGRQ